MEMGTNKIIIHPKYKSDTTFETFFKSIASYMKRTDEVYDSKTIYQARNIIKTFNINGTIFNVKSYKIPIFINRIIYTFIRPTKAQRAYEYAQKLLSMGVDTPTPIAYSEYYESRLFHLLKESYFISLHTPLDGNLRIFGTPGLNFDTVKDLAIAFGRYTAQIHEKGIYHIDYSPGNILYQKKEDGSYHFSLIDINRMKFCRVSKKKGCKNFQRMWATDIFFDTVAHAYAEERGFNDDECVKLIFYYRDQDRKKRRRKEMIKKIFLRIKEGLN